MPDELEHEITDEGSEGTPIPPPDTEATTDGTEDSPAPAPEPEDEPERDRFAALEERLLASEERERKYLEMLERTQQPKPEKQAEEPEVDIRKVIADNFQGASAEALTKLTDALEAKYGRTFAKRDDVARYTNTTAQMAQQHAEQQAQAALRSRKVPDSDITEAQKRIQDWARKNPGQYHPEWPTAEVAYKLIVADIQQERLYGEADKAAAKKQNVHQRQQRQVQPVSEPPAGTGKVELDVKKWRKDFEKTHGRRPSTDDLLAETMKTGA